MMKFSPTELDIMESLYLQSPYVRPDQAVQLAESFRKPTKMVTGWFRTRRRKAVMTGKAVNGLSKPISSAQLEDLQQQLHRPRKRSSDSHLVACPLGAAYHEARKQLNTNGTTNWQNVSNKPKPEFQNETIVIITSSESDEDSINVLEISPEKERDMARCEVSDDHNAYIPVRPETPLPALQPSATPFLSSINPVPSQNYNLMWNQQQVQIIAQNELQRRMQMAINSWYAGMY